jgi:hypothetical protein
LIKLGKSGLSYHFSDENIWGNEFLLLF